MKTEIKVSRIRRFNQKDMPTKAICDITLNEEFLVKGFRLIEGKDGLFVYPPREKGKTGKWVSLALTLTESAKLELEKAVIKAYNNKM